MGYDVKRKESGVSGRSGGMPGWVQRLLVNVMWVLVVFGVFMGTGIFAYSRYEPFQKAVDELWGFTHPFYVTYGIWPTLGVAVLIIAAVWALIEEMDRKEKKREAMKEWMK
ncbi:hypothetical protein [Ammoniphilus sp. YIM 78166]|uniref:hypothetical protein n=1 Tax=Ammoniphilus sp. YIM 78166 TaxID=1644106 RepID=UPI00106F9E91|nr:hypothetical protein [Ammoniphilus sp. YIM 78166]